MKILDLFAGIGGFSLAAHWAGWETAAFVEWDGFCQKVLNKNFPNVPVYGDIKQFDGTKYRGSVDLICGGFPCQPFSTAGKRNGTNDDRYLWPEMLRVIREVQPAWVVGENVAGLISMDGGVVLEQICADLEGEGYSVQPFVIPACAVGAPHRRDRIWIVANACGNGHGRQHRSIEDTRAQSSPQSEKDKREWVRAELGGESETIANTQHQQRNGRRETRGGRVEPSDGTQFACDPNSEGHQGSQQPGTLGEGSRPPRPITQSNSNAKQWSEHWLQTTTRLCRMDDGLSRGMDRHRTKRLKALGNSIVPQVAYQIFQAINQVDL